VEGIWTMNDLKHLSVRLQSVYAELDIRTRERNELQLRLEHLRPERNMFETKVSILESELKEIKETCDLIAFGIKSALPYVKQASAFGRSDNVNKDTEEAVKTLEDADSLYDEKILGLKK
jgi:hypothetical protein